MPLIERFLRSFFKDGAFLLRLPDGRAISVNGASEADAALIVHLKSRRAVRRIARKPGLAAGEAYMDGELIIERGSLYDLLAIATRNLRNRAQGRRRFWRRWPRNGRRAAHRNVAHHYDLSGELYRRFLDADRQYSCAYFPHAACGLDDAQIAKKRHIAAKLLLEPGQRVLDIGSGWGGMALTLAGDYGAEVLGITMSREQLQDARARAREQRLHDRAAFELRDYRDVAGSFDRIVSVGMFEHVGPTNYQTYFDQVARLLKACGVALIHTIGRCDAPGFGNAFIEKYIFPGGVIPSLSQIIPAVERSGLILTDLEVLTLHYAETLKAWRERFAAHRAEIAAVYDERFCRMWEFYLAGSEAGFREGSLVVFQLQLAKDRASVPQTRDYITQADHATESDRIAAE